jgi:hypothetical protein
LTYSTQNESKYLPERLLRRLFKDDERLATLDSHEQNQGSTQRCVEIN